VDGASERESAEVSHEVWIDGSVDCWISELGCGREWLHGCTVASLHGPV